MSWRTCILLTLLAVVHGDYNPSTTGAGYTAPAINSPPPSPHTPLVTYSAPTPVTYTTAVVHTQTSTPTTASGPVKSTPSSGTPYHSSSQTDGQVNKGYPNPWLSYPPLQQQFPPGFISQYYKQPPYFFSHSPQNPAPYPSPNPQAFQQHSCTTPNNPSFQPQQPYFQPNYFQVPNPLSFLNGIASPPSFHAMVNPPAPRGPQPSPGYYSPSQSPSQPLFSVGYTPTANRPSPYNVH